MTNNSQFSAGQRVWINEEDEPAVHVGKMAIVDKVEVDSKGTPLCVLRVDRESELLKLPQRYIKHVVMNPSTLLANDLLLAWDMDPPKERFLAYTQDNSVAGHLIETLLFYDRIIIPTVDFAIIVPLVHWFGVDLFTEMLIAEAISFVRFTGGLSYVGNGHGLTIFEIHPGKTPEIWSVRAARCPIKEAVILQLNNRLDGIADEKIDSLGKLVEVCTVDSAQPEFDKKVADETYRDVLGSDVLREFYAIKNTNLKKLSGVDANQMRVFSSLIKPAIAGDEIDVMLRLGMLNLEAYLAEEAGARDMVTDRGFSRLLAAKLDRFTGGSTAHESFTQLLDIEGIPDIKQLIADGGIPLADVWKFRNTNLAGEFREWFDVEGPADPLKLTQDYVATLREGNFASSGKSKIIRFLVVQGIGASLAPITGGLSVLASLGISAADSFLLDRIKRGYKPRYFIDSLKHNFFSD